MRETGQARQEQSDADDGDVEDCDEAVARLEPILMKALQRIIRNSENVGTSTTTRTRRRRTRMDRDLQREKESELPNERSDFLVSLIMK